MQKISEKHFVEERALYNSEEVEISYSVFSDGESPLKESCGVTVNECTFRGRYPLWYCTNVRVNRSLFFETARAGAWYTNGIEIVDSVVNSPKTFRRCNDITLKNVSIPNGKETLWHCNRVTLDTVNTVGEYFLMNSENIVAENITVTGPYAFDGCKNIEIRGSHLICKDAFWNCENVTVYDSVIVGEYIGRNYKNVTFVNCTIESNQGLCYMNNAVMKNCKLVNTDLAFEYSTVNAEITSDIVSVKNPTSGKITAHAIGEVILDESFVDPTKTEITILNK